MMFLPSDGNVPNIKRMADYGHPLRFGVSINPDSADLASSLALARQADRAGLHYLAVQDHPYQPGYLDAWTLLTYLATQTERITVLPDVLDLQLRPPTMVAKAAASLASIVGTRIDLAVGGGASAQGIAAMGGTALSGNAMVAFTEEAVQFIRRALRGEKITLTTARHRIAGYQAGPVPAAPIPVWLGAMGPKMLAATGRSSDGWVCPLNIYVPPGQVAARQELIDNAAAEAGRDPRSVRRIYNVTGTIGATGGPGLSGTVEKWIDTLSRWVVELGFDTFVFWPAKDPASQLELFTSSVIPDLQQRVARQRGQA